MVGTFVGGQANARSVEMKCRSSETNANATLPLLKNMTATDAPSGQERVSRLPQTIVPTHHQPNIGHVQLRDIDAVGGAHDDGDELLSAIAKVSLV